uniref:Secreted protein n=1 Tax=Rhipicephalus appendiculatus TaxID=34631 RepID=A0A131YAA8_RHIAP
MRARLLVCVCMCVCVVARRLYFWHTTTLPPPGKRERESKLKSEQRIRTMPPCLTVYVSSMCAVAARCLVFRRPHTGAPPLPPRYRACAYRCGGRPNVYIKLIYETVCGIYIPCDNTLWEMA